MDFTRAHLKNPRLVSMVIFQEEVRKWHYFKIPLGNW